MRVALWSLSIQLQGIVVLAVSVVVPGCGTSTGRPARSLLLMQPLPPWLDLPPPTAESASPLTLTVSPNPLNPATTLTMVVPTGGGSVLLTIHSVDGRCACRLVTTEMTAGVHAVVWRGQDDTGRTLPSGVYFACLRVGAMTRVKKLTIVQ